MISYYNQNRNIPSNKYNWEYMGIAIIYLKGYIYAELNVVIPK